MVNTAELLGILKINGVREGSPTTEVDGILNALRYSDSDKQQAVEFLNERGWFSSVAPTTLEVTSVPPSTTETATPPYTTVPKQIGYPPQPEASAIIVEAPHQSIVLLFVTLILMTVLILGGLAFMYWQKIDLLMLGSQKTNLIYELLVKVRNTISSFGKVL